MYRVIATAIYRGTSCTRCATLSGDSERDAAVKFRILLARLGYTVRSSTAVDLTTGRTAA